MSKLPNAESGPMTKAKLNKLMTYHDRQFVELAYGLLLGRPADETGLAHHLESLRSGENRREIAFRLAASEEGRTKGIDINLFQGYLRWRRIENTPVLGALLLIVLCLVRIRYIVREFRRLQNAAYGGDPRILS